MASLTFDRLRRMSVGEIACRGRQEASKLIERITPPSVARATGLRFESFFAGPLDTRTPEIILRRCPEHTAAIGHAAGRLMDGRIDLLGYRDLALSSPIDWHRDLVSGQRSPEIHWSRIDPLAPSMVGDSKVVWELNRHQWLVTLMQAWRLTGEPRFAGRVRDVIEDWCTRQPRGHGVNWASSLEVALRLIAWSWVAAFESGAGRASGDGLARRARAIREHARHVERYLSTYFSPNTHLTGEALGLLYAGVVFSDDREAHRWRQTAVDLLVTEGTRQISADGVHVEQATCYQRYTAEIYLHFLILSDRAGIAVPAELSERVSRLVDFLVSVNQPPSDMPAIGDADGGWLLPLSPRAPADCRGVFALSAAYFGRADHAWAAGGLQPEVVWLLGSSGAERFDALTAAPPTGPGSTAFEDSGYVVMRTGWGDEAARLIFDVGPMWRGPCRAHGHADMLSVQFASHGEEFLVDPGTYCYTPEPEWRRYFRGTRAHNTVTVDGRDQADPAGPFGWAHGSTAALRAWCSGPDSDYADADHQAYASSTEAIHHRRRVLFVKPDLVVIVDDVAGSARHVVESRWHFGVDVERRADDWLVGRGRRASMWAKTLSTDASLLRVARGSTRPIEGWIAPDYGRRQPTPTAVHTIDVVLPVRIVTLLVMRPPGDALPLAVRPIAGPDGMITTLYLDDSGTLIRIDDTTVVHQDS